MSEESERANPILSSEEQVSPSWRRLKEHRIAQWSIGYVAVAYGIQHAISLTREAFEWLQAVERITLLLLILGLPIVMTLAWYHGAKASRRFSTGECTIISILLVIGAFLFYIYVRPSVQIAARPATVAQAVLAVAPAIKPAADSVAVLPFLNMSGDPKEEYFSDGMTEELTSALANVSGLAVVARTSAFAFKGKNEDISVIGQALHANYLLEGSVRKAGNEVRITAQLIKAATGDHLWTDSYDRNLTDIFAVQEDVAKAIAGALQVPLGLKQGEYLVANRDIDPESYENYLRAKALVNARVAAYSFTAPIALLEQVVTHDPNYAPAWALLAQAYILEPAYMPLLVAESRHAADGDFPKAEAAERRALQLDPGNADAYEGLGQIQAFRGKPLDAEQSFKQALSLDPLNPDALHHYSLFLAQTGQLKQAVAIREQLRSLEPEIRVFNINTIQILSIAGDYSQALAIAQQSNITSGIARIYAAEGRYKEAADIAAKIPHESYPPGVVEAAARLLRTAPSQPPPQEEIPLLGALSWVFAYVGLPERALEGGEHKENAGIGFLDETTMFWQSDAADAAVRKTEQFKALVRKMGDVDYWRARGWPQWCHPTTGDDFACD